MRDAAHPLPEQLSLPALLHALSDPVRLQIVCRLRDGSEISCGRFGVPVSKSTLSHHLKVLRDAGLTRTRAEGVQRLVSLRELDVEARFPGLLSCVLRAGAPLVGLAQASVPGPGAAGSGP
jgi:DNA-binding transcriptional ArsR family regulator